MTIFALSSGPGRAGVAVVRISGRRAHTALEAVVGRCPSPRHASYAPICHPETGEALDRGLILWLPGPGSATGEDMAELHVHGGRAVVDGVLDALAHVAGLRPAEPGEFTRRAFDNGKLDLTQVEGLADLIAAETVAQRRQALRQMDGALAALYESWRGSLVRASAHAEAAIDFSDEELPPDLVDRLAADVRDLRAEIEAHLDDNHLGERLRDGIQIAIVGAPNVGKSSLINALAKRDAAIVAPTPGTTRDVIEVHLDLGGYPVTVADTAGLRESADEVEAEGVARARARASAADFVLRVHDASQWPESRVAGEDGIIVVNK
jgi:tRNA modification GTPase